MSAEFRVLSADDAEPYRALRLEALEREPFAFGRSVNEYRNETLESIRARFTSPDAITLGAFLDGALIGMASLVQRSNEKERHKADIYAVYVTKPARGRGISRVLLTRLLERARSSPGLEQVLISVSNTQHAARTLYASLGFVAFGHEPRALKIGDEYVAEDHMMLVLEPS